MQTSKKGLIHQRKLMDRKLASWLQPRTEEAPPSGWLKAIRGALGINTRQLAARLGVEHSAVLQLEKREAEGRVTLEKIQEVARAMKCKLVYAVVPDQPFSSLDSIVEAQAHQAAQAILRKIDHSMKLERQGVSSERNQERVHELAMELKFKMDPRIWALKPDDET